MIFKNRTISHIILTYGYEKPGDNEYCLSFMGSIHPLGVEFFNLISKKPLKLKDFKVLHRFVNNTVREVGHERWFMDVVPGNRAIAERFHPFKEEKTIMFDGVKTIRFWFQI